MFPLLSLEQWMMRVNAQVKWPGSKSIVQASDPVAVAVGRNLFIWRVESKCISCTYMHNFKKHHWVNQGCIETDMYMIYPLTQKHTYRPGKWAYPPVAEAETLFSDQWNRVLLSSVRALFSGPSPTETETSPPTTSHRSSSLWVRESSSLR